MSLMNQPDPPAMLSVGSPSHFAYPPLRFIMRMLSRTALFFASLLYALGVIAAIACFVCMVTLSVRIQDRLLLLGGFLALATVLGLLGWKKPRLVWSAAILLLTNK